jgi:rubrerythrin
MTNAILSPQLIDTNSGGLSRRGLLNGGQTFLSAGVLAMLAGCAGNAAMPMSSNSAQNDVAILNVALGLEHEAIAAYQLGAESKLLDKPVLDVAVLFQSHHKEHRDALAATIRKLGGAPVEPKMMNDYAMALNAAAIKNQGDILKLAARLERGAANAYLGVIPSFKDAELAKVAGRLAADETMHWTALTGALSESLPMKALSFAA